MTTPYVGEIRMFAGNFAPQGWAFCDGSLLAVGSNDALFSLLGTIYGGDGRTTFALPDLRGRVPIHAGSGPGLTPRALGSGGGLQAVTLTTAQIPSHRHPAATDAPADSGDPGGALPADTGPVGVYAAPGTAASIAGAVPSGGSQPHNNRSPYLGLNFIIALFGIYPSTS